MTADKTIPIIFLTALFLFAMPAMLYFRKLPETELTPSEKVLIAFSNKPVTMLASPPQATFSGLDSPVKALKKPVKVTTMLHTETAKSQLPPNNKDINPAGAAPDRRPHRSLSSLPRVSMIYSEADTKMAVIGGEILQEGSTFGNYQIIKIEKTRVQIRSAGKVLWLNMD